MKKLLSILLAASLLCGSFSLFSCGNREPDEDQSTAEVTEAGEPEPGPDPSKVNYVPVKQPVEEVMLNGSYRSGNSEFITEETVKKYPRLTNLPTLYIDLDEGRQKEDIQHGSYIAGKYTFVDDNVLHSYYEQRLQIKGRGNWSWSFAQKPYTLKLDNGADFLGMGKAKKWVLVTVHSDKSMMHNFMTQKFAKALGMPGICDNEYIDVVMNGQYIGTYVLTEKIQIHDDRIEVEDDRGVLFEIEMVYRHSCKYCITMFENDQDPSRSIHLELLDYMDWDMDSLTRAQSKEVTERLRTLKEFFDMLGTAMKEGDWATLTQMIDVDSFVNWYLLNELTRNYDSAFVTSCYCYINEDNYLVMGPVWDFDTCYGIQSSTYEGQHIQDAPWFRWLFKNCPEYRELVNKRWEEIRKPEGPLYDFYMAIDQIADYFKQSEEMEHKLYPTSELLDVPFKDAVKFFKEWLLNRIEWMDSEFLSEEHGELDPTTTGYTKNKYIK